MSIWDRVFARIKPGPSPQRLAPKTYPEGEFDIEGMPVFSVERNVRKDVTIIGFHNEKADDGHTEWHLPISPAAHAELARRFRAKLGLPLPPVQPLSS